MAGGISGDDADRPLSEINVTPLVDVMLVLLAIFTVAAPLMAQALRVDLPKARAEKLAEPRVTTLEVLADGAVPYQRIAEVLAMARQSEVRRIVFATQTP